MNPTLHAQILTLRKYQAWRTGEDERTMDEAGIVPREITAALNAVIEVAENHLRDATKKVEPLKYGGPDSDDYVTGWNDAIRAIGFAQPSRPYSLDKDPAGIRALVADAIRGAIAFGAQGVNPPPQGHWLTEFWEAGKPWSPEH
ncbi:hypothetical protein [Neopusillimonas aromaticivorans]|uniref:hypothetical protein n=1 Tax=Neopusillimonas aromaticivorans TaxID=2979868 RepID=UPI002591AE76|nr:hypothetical protein [Neopusillimonas aromaticivorans]WJJ93398.1 hypothetical protein N7E01_15765 [Neopusillimonas aromaticivorans]